MVLHKAYANINNHDSETLYGKRCKLVPKAGIMALLINMLATANATIPIDCALVNDSTNISQKEVTTSKCKIALKTNMLHDIVAIPNIGAELMVGHGMTVSANFWNSWWASKKRAVYWRTYGAETAWRYWLSVNKYRSLTGHHIGLYAQVLLYDFEWKNKGYLSGEPGKNIFHHPTFAFGAEYGFSISISPKFNLDFVIGFGYMGGQYSEYKPIDGHFVWLCTKQRHWIGPTKVEISLVWMLGISYGNKLAGE